MRHPRQASRRPDGVALIAVLWLIALLTLLATTVTTMSVGLRRAVVRSQQHLQLQYTADSAIRVTLLQLVAPQRPRARFVLNQQSRLTLFGTAVDVVIRRESGCIDLNRAPEDLLFATFVADGWDERRARAMAARIADWRDADDLTRDLGAERAEYAAAGLRYEPRNGPFESVDELRQVLGGESISAALMDAFTVYSHLPEPTAVFANPAAYRALLYADAHRLGDRTWLADSEARSEGADALPADETPSLDGEVVRVTACVGSGDTRVCRSVYSRPTGNVHKPLQVFDWKDAAVELRQL